MCMCTYDSALAAHTSQLTTRPRPRPRPHFEAVLLLEEGLDVVGVHVRLALGLDAKPEAEGLVVDGVLEREAVVREDVLERPRCLKYEGF